MKRTKFTESQIAFALHKAETGVKGEEICSKIGISDATFIYGKRNTIDWGL
jgi:putative transposase